MTTEKEPRLKKPAREDWLRFAYLGFASFSNVVGFIVGLKLTSAASAASLQVHRLHIAVCAH
jgi:hypothetical protein